MESQPTNNLQPRLRILLECPSYRLFPPLNTSLFRQTALGRVSEAVANRCHLILSLFLAVEPKLFRRSSWLGVVPSRGRPWYPKGQKVRNDEKFIAKKVCYVSMQSMRRQVLASLSPAVSRHPPSRSCCRGIAFAVVFHQLLLF
jgi:hypothetical protein